VSLPFLIFCGVLLYVAAAPAVICLVNLILFRPPRQNSQLPVPRVSILIPARNEEANIRGVTASALGSGDVDLEVLVLDDHSTDRTATIVESIARNDSRLRLLRGTSLPPGWAGKMFACQQLAEAARGDWLLFLDADVRITTDAARRVVDYARTAPGQPALISGVPRQITGSFLERLLVPLIDFVLLAYLPLWVMRRNPSPSLAAAVGQFVLVDRKRYLDCGGHGAIRTTFHDGIYLPRLFRQKGILTDLVDITGLASCRMYQGARQTWNGFLKNAGEGLGAPGVIVPMTFILLGGQVLPWLLLPFAQGLAQNLLLAAGLSGYACRIAAAVRFRQSWLGVLCHPAGVTVMEWIQWLGFIRLRRGIRAEWKGRTAV
jgi:glycosyltransferase involved in cell wall biosynthesis